MDGVLVDGSHLRPLVVLGATGSIGTQTLEVAEHLGARVHAVVSRRPSAQIRSIAQQWPDARVVVVEPGTERDGIVSALGSRVSFGPDAVEDAAATQGCIVVNGIVGAAGLRPSLAALHAGNRLALANKESLIAGGPLVTAALADGGGELIPIDSEHSAVWQCLAGEDPASVARIILTASGGPFVDTPAPALRLVSVAEALAHPTWDMGKRITIDSATMMNKAFEVIEAHHLFGIPYDRIEVLVHPQSYVHSLVEFRDGIVKAELGPADMRKPIQHAITWPARAPAEHAPLGLAGRALEFREPRRSDFPCLDLGYEAGRRGGNAPTVLNAADEVAVQAFLDERIRFTDISGVVEHALRTVEHRPLGSVADVEASDADGRRRAAEAVQGLAG